MTIKISLSVIMTCILIMRVTRYVRFNLKTVPEKYFGEKRMLFLHREINLMTCFLELTVMNNHLGPTTRPYLGTALYV